MEPFRSVRKDDADRIRRARRSVVAENVVVAVGDEAPEGAHARFDVGFEWFHRAATGPWGTPFVAANVGFRGENAYNADVAVQAGGLWRHPDKRLAQWRVYGEYSSGKSYFGQLFRTRENFGAVGISLDY